MSILTAVNADMLWCHRSLMFRLNTDLVSCVSVGCEAPHCYGVQHRLRAEQQQQCTVAERAASQHAAVSAARPPRAPGTNQKWPEAPPGVAQERGSGAAEAVTGAAAHRRRQGGGILHQPAAARRGGGGGARLGTEHNSGCGGWSKARPAHGAHYFWQKMTVQSQGIQMENGLLIEF